MMVENYGGQHTKLGLVFIVGILAIRMSLCTDCIEKKFNNGTSTQFFEFNTAVKVVSETHLYRIVFKNDNTTIKEATKMQATFVNGSLLSYKKSADVNVTGDVASGDFSFVLEDVSTAKTGICEFYDNGNLLNCIKLYILGKPTTPLLSSGPKPNIGEDITFTCTSLSTTVPIDHGLKMTYTWSFDNQTNPSGGRYSYSRNSFTISNVQTTDKNKSVLCRATEGEFEYKIATSNNSNEAKVDLYYTSPVTSPETTGTAPTLDEAELLADVEEVSKPTSIIGATVGGGIAVVLVLVLVIVGVVFVKGRSNKTKVTHIVVVRGRTIGQSAPNYGPLTFREKVARYKLLKGAKLIEPSIPNISPDRYLEYFKTGTVDDAQADFLMADPEQVTFSQEREQLEGKIGDHIFLTLSKFGRYQVPALTIYTLVLSRDGFPSFVTEVINYAEGIQEEPAEEAPQQAPQQ